MAKRQENLPFPKTTTPTRQHDQEGGRHTDDPDDDADICTATGCSCFRVFRFVNLSRSDGGEDSRSFLNQQRRGNDNDDDHDHQHRETTWLENKMREAKEFSEVVAGPKWKNFIRKLGKLINGKKKRRNDGKFQYDQYSYALNFDEGEDDEDDAYLLNNGYSSKFVAPFSGDQERRPVL